MPMAGLSLQDPELKTLMVKCVPQVRTVPWTCFPLLRVWKLFLLADVLASAQAHGWLCA